MWLRGLSLLCCIGSVLPLRGQDGKDLLYEVTVALRLAAADNLQQVYVVTPDNFLIKYDAAGRELYRYSNNYLGELAWIDATNPIQVLAYYPGLQTVVTLDVTLNEIARTNLVTLGLFNIGCLCAANDGQLWILDEMDFNLKKVSRQGRTLASSENLLLTLGAPPRCRQMLERNNRVYMLDEQQGILVFDNLGTYDRKYAVQSVDHFQVLEDQLFFMENGVPTALDLRLFTHQRLRLPTDESTPLFFELQPDRLFLFYPDGYKVYKR